MERRCQALYLLQNFNVCNLRKSPGLCSGAVFIGTRSLASPVTSRLSIWLLNISSVSGCVSDWDAEKEKRMTPCPPGA